MGILRGSNTGSQTNINLHCSSRVLSEHECLWSNTSDNLGGMASHRDILSRSTDICTEANWIGIDPGLRCPSCKYSKRPAGRQFSKNSSVEYFNIGGISRENSGVS